MYYTIPGLETHEISQEWSIIRNRRNKKRLKRGFCCKTGKLTVQIKYEKYYISDIWDAVFLDAEPPEPVLQKIEDSDTE